MNYSNKQTNNPYQRSRVQTQHNKRHWRSLFMFVTLTTRGRLAINSPLKTTVTETQTVTVRYCFQVLDYSTTTAVATNYFPSRTQQTAAHTYHNSKSNADSKANNKRSSGNTSVAHRHRTENQKQKQKYLPWIIVRRLIILCFLLDSPQHSPVQRNKQSRNLVFYIIYTTRLP